MERRRFLRLLLAVFGSTALASFLYPMIRFLAPPAGEAKTEVLTLKKSDIPIGGSRDIIFNNRPAVVINHTGKGLLAFTKVCTHLGCLVEYDEIQNKLICPCHAGTFDLEGNVLSGPPPKPLPKLPLRVQGEDIIIG